MSLPKLSADLLKQRPELLPSHEALSTLPEKILQFGTGVLLRGLPDYFVNKANQEGIFNGRIVVVKSTAGGGTDAFKNQNSLYSHTIRGIENGQQVDTTIINSAISRTINANNDWQEILKCASNPDMKIVVSNTTEVGIQYVEDDLTANPPVSFPGKLTAFLLARYQAFNGSEEAGMVIIPTELIIDNGNKLKDIILKHASTHDLDKSFIRWIEESNYFCSSLVDRIVPGKPNAETIIERYTYFGMRLVLHERTRYCSGKYGNRICGKLYCGCDVKRTGTGYSIPCGAINSTRVWKPSFGSFQKPLYTPFASGYNCAIYGQNETQKCANTFESLPKI